MVSIRTVPLMEFCREAEFGLGLDEDVVPEAGFEVRLHLGQVEVGAGAAGEELLRVVEGVEAEVEEGAGHGFAVDEHVALFEVPAAGADEEDGGRVVEFVTLFGGRVFEGDGAADGVAQVELAVEQVVPGGRGGVLEVGHEDLGAGVEGVDDHLAVDGAGDLDAAVEQVGGDGRDGPLGVADVLGLGQEVGLLAGVERGLAGDAGGEQFLAAGVEAALQADEEGEWLPG